MPPDIHMAPPSLSGNQVPDRAEPGKEFACNAGPPQSTMKMKTEEWWQQLLGNAPMRAPQPLSEFEQP